PLNRADDTFSHICLLSKMKKNWVTQLHSSGGKKNTAQGLALSRCLLPSATKTSCILQALIYH
ncbi:MAG TPA: hypothetical protein PKE23_03895, partial [Anaerolineales bacterium]|nr:hypothetical protein [Anaerolineales bacterium]